MISPWKVKLALIRHTYKKCEKSFAIVGEPSERFLITHMTSHKIPIKGIQP